MEESKLLQIPDLITSRADPKPQALKTARGSSDGQHRHLNKRTHGRPSPVDALSPRQARAKSRSWASSDHFILISRSAAPVQALINFFRALRHPMGERGVLSLFKEIIHGDPLCQAMQDLYGALLDVEAARQCPRLASFTLQ